MSKTKELKIPAEFMQPNWSTDRVVIRRLKFGEQLRIQDEGTNLKISGSTFSGKASQEIFAVALIIKSVAEAPWELNNPSVIFDLDVGLGVWLLNEVSELNNVGSKKKESLESS